MVLVQRRISARALQLPGESSMLDIDYRHDRHYVLLVPMPQFDPSPDLLELGLSRIEDPFREVLLAQLSQLEEPQRRTVLWLVAAEGLVLAEYRLDETKGLRMLAFGVKQPPRRRWRSIHPRHFFEERSLNITVFLAPGYSYEGPDALRLEDERGSPEQIPIESETWELILHNSVNLLYATVCCWVMPTTGGEAILTADHAVVGESSYLDDGTVSPLLWRAPGGLDAAVLDAQAGGILTALPVLPPLQEDAVEVVTKAAAARRAVSAVNQTYGTTTSAVPHTFLLDRPLQDGDSGSLVRHRTGGHGVGLYIGELNTSEGPRGLCQGLFQLESLFRFEGHCEGFYKE
jgi:hypothetical protein